MTVHIAKPFFAIAVSLFLAPLSFVVTTGEPIALYDSLTRSSPRDQGWIYLLDPTLRNRSRQVVVDGGVNLNTRQNPADRAGYFARLAPHETHPKLPESLDRNQEFQVGFSLHLIAESHSAPQHSGFSVIVLTHDLWGVELGFHGNSVFSRSDAFLRAEINESLPRSHSEAYLDYRLEIKDDTYRLTAGNDLVLTGSLKNYSTVGTPYDEPNLIYFGDNSISASASFNVKDFWVDIDPQEEPEDTTGPKPPDSGDGAVAFAVNQELSSLTLSGTVFETSQVEAQADNSLVTSLSGELYVVLRDDHIFFHPNSRLKAGINGDWKPDHDSNPNAKPANFGGVIDLGLLGTALAAVRDLEFGLSDALPGRPLQPSGENSSFSAQRLSLIIPEDGESKIHLATTSLIPLKLTLSLAGLASSTNLTELPGTLAVAGSAQTLTLPIEIEVYSRAIRDDDVKLTLKGTVVAVRSQTGAEPPRLIIRQQADQIHLTWKAEIGKSYTLQHATDLTQWNLAAETLVADTDPETWSEPLTSGPRFYRLVTSE